MCVSPQIHLSRNTITWPITPAIAEPTLLADVPNEALVMQEESFGPLLPVARAVRNLVSLRAIDASRLVHG